MLIRGMIRGFAIDRKRILLARTPLVIKYPTVAPAAIPIVATTIVKQAAPKIIERGSVGSGGDSAGTQITIKATQRASSSSSTITAPSTSTKVVSSPTVIEACEAIMNLLDAAMALWYPAIFYADSGCSINKY